MAIIGKHEKVALEERIKAAAGPREFQRRADLDNFPWDKPDHEQAAWLEAHPVLVAFLRGAEEPPQAPQGPPPPQGPPRQQAAAPRSQQSSAPGKGLGYSPQGYTIPASLGGRPGPTPRPQTPGRPQASRPQPQRPPGRPSGMPPPGTLGMPDYGAVMPQSEIQANFAAGVAQRPPGMENLTPEELQEQMALLRWMPPGRPQRSR